MNNIVLITLINLLSIVCCMGQVVVNGVIISKDTQEPLPYAHVYIKGQSGTISNLDGEFTLSLSTLLDTLVVSHISYETAILSLTTNSKFPLKVALHKNSTYLDEVTIIPYNAHELITQAIKKGVSELNKKSKTKLFYRQITKTNDKPTEIIEAFYSGITSTAGIENMSLATGRFAKLPHDETGVYPSLSNYYYFSTIPVLQQKINDFIFPLNEDFKSYYDYQINRIISPKNESEIAVVEFDAKPTEMAIFEGEVYIEVGSYDIIKMTGKIKDDMGIQFENDNIRAENALFSVDISFDRINSLDELELRSVKSELSFEMQEGTNTKNVYVVSTMFAYSQQGKANNKGGRLDNKSDIIKEIHKTKFKKKYWKNNPIIKRTLDEQSIIKSFEESNLFEYHN